MWHIFTTIRETERCVTTFMFCDTNELGARHGVGRVHLTNITPNGRCSIHWLWDRTADGATTYNSRHVPNKKTEFLDTFSSADVPKLWTAAWCFVCMPKRRRRFRGKSSVFLAEKFGAEGRIPFKPSTRVQNGLISESPRCLPEVVHKSPSLSGAGRYCYN